MLGGSFVGGTLGEFVARFGVRVLLMLGLGLNVIVIERVERTRRSGWVGCCIGLLWNGAL